MTFTAQTEPDEFQVVVRDKSVSLHEVQEGRDEGTGRLNASHGCWVVDGLRSCAPIDDENVEIVVKKKCMCCTQDEIGGVVAAPTVSYNANWLRTIERTRIDRRQIVHADLITNKTV